MSTDKDTAYCGIYCPDCLRHKNNYSEHAICLKKVLEEIDFNKYAEIDTPFGANYKNYKEFKEVLDTLINSQCNSPCRVGGGCSGIPCKIMECCTSKNYEGCWECAEFEECDKFDILLPRCGDSPKRNLRIIKSKGVQKWASLRNQLYIWQS